MKRLFLILFAMVGQAAFLGMSGCAQFGSIGSFEGDVSHIARVWGGYESGALYELQKPVFLCAIEDGDSIHIMVIPTDVKDQDPEVISRPAGVPSREQYDQAPEAWDDVLGIVPEGTRLQCSRVLKEGVWPDNNTLIYCAVVSNGEYQFLEIEINGLSHIYNCDCHPITLKPNPELLKLIKDNPDQSADSRQGKDGH